MVSLSGMGLADSDPVLICFVLVINVKRGSEREVERWNDLTLSNKIMDKWWMALRGSLRSLIFFSLFFLFFFYSISFVVMFLLNFLSIFILVFLFLIHICIAYTFEGQLSFPLWSKPVNISVLLPILYISFYFLRVFCSFLFFVLFVGPFYSFFVSTVSPPPTHTHISYKN